MTDPPLPTEILCKIFSYVNDEKSIRSATATCRQWEEIIRGNEKLSGNVSLKSIWAKDLRMKIENSEWIWDRWPSLKTLQLVCWDLRERSEEMKSLKLVKFDQACQKLEKIILLDVNCDLTEISPIYDPKVGEIKELSFNPKLGIEPLSIEHVTSMSIRYPGPEMIYDVPDLTLKLIGKNAKNLKNLAIIMKPQCWLPDTIRMGLAPMFRGLKDSLKSVCLDFVVNDYTRDMKCELIEALAHNCVNLESLQIKDHNPYSPSPIVFNCFKNLKELIVPKLCFINSMIGDINSLTHLFVENASLQEFKDFDFANIGEKLKKLRKFDVKVVPGNTTTNRKATLNDDEWCYVENHIYLWKQKLDVSFHDVTEVKIVILKHIEDPQMNIEPIRIELIKKPFQNTNHYLLFTKPDDKIPWEDETKKEKVTRIPNSREEISREFLSEFNLRSQSQETPEYSDQEDTENPENLDQNYQVLIYPLLNLEDDLDNQQEDQEDYWNDDWYETSDQEGDQEVAEISKRLADTVVNHRE